MIITAIVSIIRLFFFILSFLGRTISMRLLNENKTGRIRIKDNIQLTAITIESIIPKLSFSVSKIIRYETANSEVFRPVVIRIIISTKTETDIKIKRAISGYNSIKFAGISSSLIITKVNIVEQRTTIVHFINWKNNVLSIERLKTAALFNPIP